MRVNIQRIADSFQSNFSGTRNGLNAPVRRASINQRHIFPRRRGILYFCQDPRALSRAHSHDTAGDNLLYTENRKFSLSYIGNDLNSRLPTEISIDAPSSPILFVFRLWNKFYFVFFRDCSRSSSGSAVTSASVIVTNRRSIGQIESRQARLVARTKFALIANLIYLI